MATQEQIDANRKNAQRSTGPRTPEGKATAAQNSLKHGLLARQALIATEDPAEFDLHRDQWLAELDPKGPTESLLVSRIITLSWRLKRSERVQTQALNALTAKMLNPYGDITQTLTAAANRPDGQDPDLPVASALIKDFATEKVLDRLLMYERRIEHSLHKALRDLDYLRLCDDFRARTEHPNPDVCEQDPSLHVDQTEPHRPEAWHPSYGPHHCPAEQNQHHPQPFPRAILASNSSQLCKTNPISKPQENP
ncbi:MAG: hypothetical protein KAR47_21280 [Planctomycetes bacterium]|nr:hypothetical protein [Planctomycetota bacterium]